MGLDDGGRERFEATLFSIGDAVVTTDLEGRIREMNPAAEQLTGWSEANALGRAFDEVVVAVDEAERQPVSTLVATTLRDGTVSSHARAALLVARDGHERRITASGAPIRDARGSIQGAVVVFRAQDDEHAQLRELEERESRYRLLFAANPHAMWVYDADSLAFLDVNGAAVAHYGYSREEFLRMTLADIRPHEDPPSLTADLTAVPDAFEGGRRWRHRRKDGTHLTVEISSQPVPWMGRRGRVVLAHDVTAQASLEARLQWQAKMLTRLASREPLQTLLDELATFLCTLCPGVTSAVLLRDAASEAVRLAASDGPLDVEGGDPTAIAEVGSVFGALAARPAPFAVSDIATDPALAQYCDVANRFGVRAVWSHPFFDSGGRALGTVAMCAATARPPAAAETEIAQFAATLAGVMVERSRNAEELHDREGRLRAIFENEPECVKVLDLDGHLMEMNPSGLRLIEADSIDAVRGVLVGDLVSPAFRPRFVALTREAALGGEGVLEFEMTGLKGTRRWLETHAVPLRDAHGRVTAVLSITRDVTERRALAAQLLQAQKLESVGRLAGGIAHDFNNMLNVILGQTELALETLPADSPAAASLDEVMKAAQRSVELTRQLLAFARREPSLPRAIDLNGRIQEVLGMLERIIGEGIAVAWQPAQDLWPVRFDPGQLDHVLANLAVNARDAMAGVGTLTVTTATATRAEGDGSAARDYVVLTVSDTGIGMDAETLGRIFEPFFTTKPQGRGTGLGLASVYGTVRQHGGLVEVESTPGAGTTFRILLPRSTEAVESLHGPDVRRASAGGKETILVVEDEPAVLRLTCGILRREGYDVLSAQTPEEAEAIVTRHDGPLQLVLTDMVMPGMSGRDLWCRLKTLRPSLRCVIMSGYSREAIDGSDGLDVPSLQKPFSLAALVEKVRGVLDEPVSQR